VLECPQLDAFGDLDLVDSLQPQIGVYCVKEVKLVFGDEWIFWVREGIRE
jgi:hypothetical protein